MRLHSPLHRKQAGMSLVEVLVSVLIMGVGLLGISAMQAAALRNNEGAYGRSQAVIQSYAITDAMRANRASAIAGLYNKAMECNVPAAGGLVENDWHEWMTAMKASLGNTGSTCGQVACVGDTCTVTVQWDDSRGSYASDADFSTAETRTFVTVTRL